VLEMLGGRCWRCWAVRHRGGCLFQWSCALRRRIQGL